MIDFLVLQVLVESVILIVGRPFVYIVSIRKLYSSMVKGSFWS